jgi:hypothetical protein
MRQSIAQGTKRIVRAYDITDDADPPQPLMVTGWSVYAIARRDNTAGVLLAEWSTSPEEGQGQATAVGREVHLLITPAMSSAWGDTDRVLIQAFMTHPTDLTMTERIINEVFDLDREAVPV